MSEDMIERVARALCLAGGFPDPDAVDHRAKFGSDPVEIDSQPIWKRFEPESRAAIAAMRDPTRAMLSAGGDTEGMKDVDGAVMMAHAHGYNLRWEERGEPCPLAQAWSAMIDAALKTPAKPA